MKNVWTVLLLISGVLIASSCTKENLSVGEENRVVTLTFDIGQKNNLKINTLFIGKPAILFSEEGFIRKIDAISNDTGEKVIGYVLSEKAHDAYNVVKEKGKIYRGYGFTGECFEYGTFIEANDGSSVFIPDSGYSGPGFEPICPDYGEAFA